MTQETLREGQYADVMPDMSDEEFDALKRSIEEDGLKHPIEVTEDGVIVDGHHRFKACRELGIEPETKVVEEPTVEQAMQDYSLNNSEDGESQPDGTDDYDYPHPDELESVPEEEWPENQSETDESGQETRSGDSQQSEETTRGQEVEPETESADESPAPAESEHPKSTTDTGQDEKCVDELEAVLEDIIRYFENKDPEGMERAVSRAEGML